MPTPTLFTVRSEDLERLNAGEAVDFFRELLWAEARTIGLPSSNVRVSGLINVSDGGIDATVEGTLREFADLIKQGRTGYQIKASSAFRPWQQSAIKNELFGERNDPTRENLASGVRDCLDESGTYILVCFKQDAVDEQYRQAIGNLKELLEQCGYTNPKVDVWGQSTLIGFLEQYPSLSLRANGRDHYHFQTHGSWSLNDDMQKDFEAGSEQVEVISALNEQLRSNDAAVHVRVGGEPGIGKTKLVLEATSADDLRPLVLYCYKPELLVDSELLNEILREDNHFSIVLVVDECDLESTVVIWNRLKHRGTRIKFVHHVPDLLPDLGQLLGGQVFALLFGKPLEVLDDFRRLDAESHREVFRRVGLLPMPFGDERAYRSP